VSSLGLALVLALGDGVLLRLADESDGVLVVCDDGAVVVAEAQQLRVPRQHVLAEAVGEPDNGAALDREADELAVDGAVFVCVFRCLDGVAVEELILVYCSNKIGCLRVSDLRLAHWWALVDIVVIVIRVLRAVLLDSRLGAVMEEMQKPGDDEDWGSQGECPRPDDSS
jgi:hypothetical protein